MRFHLITPSFNQLDYLRRCVASIQDQEVDGCEVLHEVIDGESTDGTVAWLKNEAVPHVSGADCGMYDALNKGIERMCGMGECDENTIFAWLNADEQYLPGTLAAVADYFTVHDELDILCGDALVVDPSGQLLTYWKSLPLRLPYLHIGTLYNLTCAMFFRARVFSRGVRFSQQLKAVSDLMLVEELLQQGAQSATLARYLSSYTFAPENISNQPHAIEERQHYLRRLSFRQRAFINPLARLCRAGERLVSRARHQTFPLTYAIYTGHCHRREEFTAAQVQARWPDGRGC